MAEEIIYYAKVIPVGLITGVTGSMSKSLAKPGFIP
jgi:hypothetical protein